MSGGPVIHVELYAAPESDPATLTVKLGEEEQMLKICEGGTYKLEFPWTSRYNLTITSDKHAYVDDIRVYTYEQYGRIYDKEGNAQDLADDFRILNSRLP